MENALHKQTSPYLLQHADNPVHWQAWGPEAFAKAKADNKPILLSVGYAACHWCHVMAHESFEDKATAELMNTLFVNIKVDREERPDVDAIYQTALALLGERGGWPLTMFLTPDGAPFWGGTYFPPDSRFGRPGFPTVLGKVDEVWREKADMVAKNVSVMSEALKKTARPAAGDLIPPDLSTRLAEQLSSQFDAVHGGIGTAPKFPHVPTLELVLRAHLRTGAPKGGEAVRFTLRQMSQGGIYDHLGGGYSRYATDALWLVPHFEKMLYDNAQLIDILLLTFNLYNDRLFEERIIETADWIIREMTAEGGAFAATLDADSEGEEGRFYVWQAADVDAALGDAAEPFKKAYGVHPSGNWEGNTILNRLGQPERLDDDAEARLAEARAILFDLRETRVRPGRDDKVLADWNGLAIAALAHAGAGLGRRDWITAAVTAFDFICTAMTPDAGEGDYRLAHSFRAGRAGTMATLDDYAAMARAALVLHQTLGEARYLEWARRWVDVLEHHYRDTGGGFFFTADDATDLIVRTKSAHDGPTPSGNGFMVGVFARLWLLTGEDGYRTRAEQVIRAFSGDLQKDAFALATLVNESDLLTRAAQTVIIGAADDSDAQALVGAALTAPQPNLVMQRIDPGAELAPGHPAQGKTQLDGKATAYVCVGPVCSLPITTPKDLHDALARA
ncbi:MAG: thioredoxin domain-containing protein [Alphaproteobacteria bacterium]